MLIAKFTSADLESVGQGHHLQKSVNLGYYSADFNQILTKMFGTGADNKSVTSADLESVGQCHNFTKIIKPQMLYRRFQSNFHENFPTGAHNKSVHHVILKV